MFIGWPRRLAFLVGAGGCCFIAWTVRQFFIGGKKNSIQLHNQTRQNQLCKDPTSLEKLAPLFAFKQTIEVSSIRSRGLKLAVAQVTCFKRSENHSGGDLAAAFMILGNLCSYPQFISEFADDFDKIFGVVCQLCEDESYYPDPLSAALKFLSNLCLTPQYLTTTVASPVLKAVVVLLLRSDCTPIREQVLTLLVNISSHGDGFSNNRVIEEYSQQGISVDQWCKDGLERSSPRSDAEKEKILYLLKNLGIENN